MPLTAKSSGAIVEIDYLCYRMPSCCDGTLVHHPTITAHFRNEAAFDIC